MKCPLCSNCHSGAEAIIKLQLADRREFYLCEHCNIIFVSDAGRLNAKEEKQRYLLHQNRKDDLNYVSFLKQAINPSLAFLKPDMLGLDFGCGHSPVLAALLEEEGFTCEVYDPFFFPSLKKKQYDFIFSTEVVEHFFDPAGEFQRLDRLLLPGGYLVIMTSFWNDLAALEHWYYKNDPAHVVFYHPNTFRLIARSLHYKIVYTDSKKVIIFHKSGSLSA